MEAVTRLSTLSEAKILELVSARKVADLFALKTAGDEPIPSDTVAEEELVEASALPLNQKERDGLIQSSSPMTSPKKWRPRRNARFRVGGWFRFVASATLGLLVRASPRLAH